MANPLKDPPATLLIKLGSLAVHIEEIISPGGHPLDIAAVQGLLNDPEVKDWLAQMDRLALLPKER